VALLRQLLARVAFFEVSLDHLQVASDGASNSSSASCTK
jgi:hypothetical protein